MGAEPLFWRALEVYQRVLGREHPDTLTSMNNLAYSLQSNGAYAAAERLYRRALEGWLKNSAATGRAHPQLQTTVNNYASCLKEQGCGPEEIRRTLEELARPFGINFGAGDPPARGEPSPRLRAVLERLMADPSQAGELAAQLQREDPELFREFEQWLQNQ